MKRRFFTLIELMISIVLFCLIFLSAGGIFFSILHAWTRQKNTIELVQETRWALDFMANELRHALQIVNNKPREGSYSNQIWFILDLNNDGNGDLTVRYQQAGPTLRRGQKAGKQFVEGAEPGWNFTPICTNIANTGTNKPFYRHSSPDQDLFTITLVVRPNRDQPEGWLNRNITLATTVRLRNYIGDYKPGGGKN